MLRGMFSWETLLPGIRVDIILIGIIIADQLHPFMATVLPNGSGLL